MAHKLYFGFALADSMFVGNPTIYRTSLSPKRAVSLLQGTERELVSCINPSHVATIDAAKSRYGLEVEVPASPPQVQVLPGSSIMVMGVRGLPRLTDRHEYTEEEVASATFSFSLYTVSINS